MKTSENRSCWSRMGWELAESGVNGCHTLISLEGKYIPARFMFFPASEYVVNYLVLFPLFCRYSRKIGYDMFDDSLLEALNAATKQIYTVRSVGAMRWLFRLANTAVSTKSSRELVYHLISLLADVSSCYKDRISNDQKVLQSRYIRVLFSRNQYLSTFTSVNTKLSKNTNRNIPVPGVG